jgi:anti-sigma-K factor RskA
MSHLTPEELIDLVEGTEAGDPIDRSVLAGHLASCAACRRQFEDARVMLAVTAETPIEEPSPLFWDHLSARVRESVAAESAPRNGWRDRLGSVVSISHWRWTASAAALAVLVVAAALTFDRTANAPVRTTPVDTVEADAQALSQQSADFDLNAAEEASLMLLADLAGDLTWEDASEAGLMMRRGTVEEVMHELTAEERAELHRLLQAELDKGRGV